MPILLTRSVVAGLEGKRSWPSKLVRGSLRNKRGSFELVNVTIHNGMEKYQTMQLLLTCTLSQESERIDLNESESGEVR